MGQQGFLTIWLLAPNGFHWEAKSFMFLSYIKSEMIPEPTSWQVQMTIFP